MIDMIIMRFVRDGDRVKSEMIDEKVNARMLRVIINNVGLRLR